MRRWTSSCRRTSSPCPADSTCVEVIFETGAEFLCECSAGKADVQVDLDVVVDLLVNTQYSCTQYI